MHDCLEATVKQLLNLVWFCKKVNIPFRVYGFTNCYYDDVVHTYDDIKKGIDREEHDVSHDVSHDAHDVEHAFTSIF